MNNERRKSIARAVALIDEAKSIIEECLDDELSYRDNMPESIQSGQKGEDAQTAIDALEAAQDTLEISYNELSDYLS